NCLYSSSRFMLASWLFLVLCHESNIGTLNAFPGTRVKYSGSTTFRGVAVPSTELSPFSFVDCNNKEGIKWPKKFAFEPTEELGRAYWIARTDSCHHPVTQKAVRKLGTAEACLTAPIFVSVIALYRLHVVA